MFENSRISAQSGGKYIDSCGCIMCAPVLSLWCFCKRCYVRLCVRPYVRYSSSRWWRYGGGGGDGVGGGGISGGSCGPAMAGLYRKTSSHQSCLKIPAYPLKTVANILWPHYVRPSVVLVFFVCFCKRCYVHLCAPPYVRYSPRYAQLSRCHHQHTLRQSFITNTHYNTHTIEYIQGIESRLPRDLIKNRYKVARL